jgi:hypothetical protein
MKASGYGKGYEYAHDQPGAVVSHGHRPPNVEGRTYYVPGRSRLRDQHQEIDGRAEEASLGLEPMKKLLLALLVTAGCSSGGGGSADEKSAETEFETKIATSIAFDASLLKVGDASSTS